MKIHQIKIDFQVTESISRYVYVYLLEGKNCYMIDSGVYGSEKIIIKYLEQIGRSISDIRGIFLTHAHPDHIGTAAWFREHSGCKIYASAGESPLIEDIELQYRERPIPNFYNLAGKSCPVDVIVSDDNVINLGDDGVIKVISTPGHSKDEVSYQTGNALFTGDSIPVKGDIPIYVSKSDSLKTLEKFKTMRNIEYFYPAWDRTYTAADIMDKLNDAETIMGQIDNAVNLAREKYPQADCREVAEYVCKELKTPALMGNPLFIRTVKSHLG